MLTRPHFEIGKLASLLAVTVTPQKDINIRLPVSGPCFWFFGGYFPLFLVLPLFVLVGSVGIVSCTSCLVTAVKLGGLKSTGTARERKGSEPPDRRCLFGRYGGSLLLFSLSNTITSYGDRYPEGCTEERSSRYVVCCTYAPVDLTSEI